MTVAITRLDLSAADLREAAARTQDAKAARRMLAIALGAGRLVARGCGRGLRDGPPDAARLGAPLQRVGTGGSVRSAAPQRPAAAPVSRAASQGGGHGSSRVRTLSGTVWCAGAVSICSGGLRRSLPSSCMSARWANCCASCRSGGCRCVRSTRRANPRNKRFSAQLCRSHDRRLAAGSGSASRWRSGSPMKRGSVSRAR